MRLKDLRLFSFGKQLPKKLSQKHFLSLQREMFRVYLERHFLIGPFFEMTVALCADKEILF